MSTERHPAIVVTGAQGMLGSRVVNSLIKSGWRVLSCLRCKRDMENIKNESVIGDLSTAEVCEKIAGWLLKTKATNRAIVHLAGTADANECREDPTKAIRDNVTSTGQLLSAMARVDGVRFLLASTAAVYCKRDGSLLDESEETCPKSIYVGTKLAAECLTRAWSWQYSRRSVILRFSNIYGPESNEKTVIGRMLGYMRKGKCPEIINPNSVRDFLYIDDAVQATVMAAEWMPREMTDTFNVCTGVGTSAGKIRDELAKRVCRDVIYDEFKSTCSDNLVPSNNRIKNTIGWYPEYDVTAGLAKLLATVKINRPQAVIEGNE